MTMADSADALTSSSGKGSTPSGNVALPEYFGRGIILGMTEQDHPFAAYFVTGRSPPSRARVLEQTGTGVEGKISTRPTDPETIKRGDEQLLIYDAMLWGDGVLAVSNGRQTDDVWNISANPAGHHLDQREGMLRRMYRGGVEELQAIMEFGFRICRPGFQYSLNAATQRWDPEPDAPNFTPRISGRILRYASANPVMELNIIRHTADGRVARDEFAPVLPASSAIAITTYKGNAPQGQQLPAFEGSPTVSYSTGLRSIDDVASLALGHMGNQEFHVGLSVAVWNPAKRAFDIKVENYAKPKTA